jgi:hypothetical protein
MSEKFCGNCKTHREIGYVCYMKQLVDKLPRSDNVLFVFYDFETTQDTKFSKSATEHVLNLVCLQQFCSQCKNESDINVDCEPCGKRKHSFFDDPVGDLLTYLCRPRAWCVNVVAVAHNARTFDTQFIISRAILLKYVPN